MTQNELNRAVARATGENVSTICQRGFVPLLSIPYEREPRTVDWEDSDSQRGVSLPSRRRRSLRIV